MAISTPLQSVRSLSAQVKTLLDKLTPIMQGSPTLVQLNDVLQKLKQLDIQVAQLEVIKGQAHGTAQTSQVAQADDDVLSGGVADDIPKDKLSKKQLEMGEKVEMEHTNSKQVANEIAQDHLGEQLLEGKGKGEQDYYTELKKIHEDKCKDLPAFWRKNLDYGGESV